MGKLYLGDSMLSERLLDIRDEAELNQEDMAEILKVSQSNYSRWENGKELIPLSKLNILCNHNFLHYLLYSLLNDTLFFHLL